MSDFVVDLIPHYARGCSSAGRATALHAVGQRFNSAHLHRLNEMQRISKYRRRSLTTE